MIEINPVVGVVGAEVTLQFKPVTKTLTSSTFPQRPDTPDQTGT
jgi:hypothetical protein